MMELGASVTSHTDVAGQAEVVHADSERCAPLSDTFRLLPCGGQQL